VHRIVLDTNTIVSAIGWKGAPRKILDLCIDNKLQIVLSIDLIDEFIKVIYRPKFNFIQEETKLEIIRYLLTVAEIIKPDVEINIIDEDIFDNKFLECAVTGKARFIISGDKHLLKLKVYEKIKIISASTYLKEFFK
jgi:putative PIN family toxin of toxin-antitoxin system